MNPIDVYTMREGITRQGAVERAGVPPSQVSDLGKGRISKYTIDKLVNMAARIGLTIGIRIEQGGCVAPEGDRMVWQLSHGERAQ